jgi:hypothetical protein
MAKFRLSALRQLHADLGGILSDYDTAKAGETGEDDSGRLERTDQPGMDNPPPTPGTPRAPTAMDSANADRNLNQIPGYDRMRKNGDWTPPTKPDFFGK